MSDKLERAKEIAGLIETDINGSIGLTAESRAEATGVAYRSFPAAIALSEAVDKFGSEGYDEWDRDCVFKANEQFKKELQ